MNRFKKFIRDSLAPYSFFDHILDDLPDVRGRLIVYFIAFCLLVTGSLLAYNFNSAFISGFGNLISITAIYFAYVRPIQDVEVLEWINNTIKAVGEQSELVFQLYYQYSHFKDEEEFAEFMRTSYAPMSAYTLWQLTVAGNLTESHRL